MVHKWRHGLVGRTYAAMGQRTNALFNMPLMAFVGTRLRHRRKALAVQIAGTMRLQGRHMLSRAIAFVLGKAIFWKTQIDLLTPLVAVDFGQNRGR